MAALACVLIITPSLIATPPERPYVAPGGNNWLPSSDGVPRAITTQDLNAGLTPANLVTALLGPGVTVANVTFTGANHAAGTFSGGTGIIGFNSGIMLSSGNIAYAPGPNTQDDVTADNLRPGDLDLDGLIPGYTTYDATVLEFDFQCTGTQVIQFQYVFTSDEYNEWVNSPFNDVFGFFLNGANIALVPGGGGTPVSINNVNCDNPYNPPMGSFCNLYVNNSCADIPPGTFPCAGVRDTQMDGLTVVLTATGVLNPGMNHIKLAVADAGDHILDSNVFIQGQSFTCGTPTGACCDTVALSCANNVPEANCQGPNEVWSVGLVCSQLNPPCQQVVHTGGEACDNPIPITSLPFYDVNHTGDKGNDYSNTCLGTYDNGDDIIYELTINSTRCVDISVIGATTGDNWIGVALDTVCPPSAECLAQVTTPDSFASITNLTLTPGVYYLMIDRWPLGDDSLDFTLSVTDCGSELGACCDTVAQTCISNLPQADCNGPNEVWTLGLACTQLDPPCSPVAHPPGADCEYFFQIPSVPYNGLNTTCGKSDDYRNTCLGEFDSGQDMIYRFTLPSPRCLNVIVTGSTPSDTSFGVAVDSACPPSSACLAHTVSSGNFAMISNLSLPAGTYTLMIDGLDGVTDCVNYALVIADCQAVIGACCLSDGSCDQLADNECQLLGGVEWTAGASCNPSPCPLMKGDVNCDHAIDMLDVPFFVDALLGAYTGCDVTLADMDDSGTQDGADVALFVNALLGV